MGARPELGDPKNTPQLLTQNRSNSRPTKPANMSTNSTTSTVTGNGAHPLKAKGDRGGASCIDPRPQTTTPRRAAAAAATTGDSRAIAALAAKVGGTTRLRPSRRHPSRGRRQTPMPENVSLTSSTDTRCHETRSRAACSKWLGQLTRPSRSKTRTTAAQHAGRQTLNKPLAAPTAIPATVKPTATTIISPYHEYCPGEECHPYGPSRMGSHPARFRNPAGPSTGLQPSRSLSSPHRVHHAHPRLLGSPGSTRATTKQQQWRCDQRREPTRTTCPLCPLPWTSRTIGPSPTFHQGDDWPHCADATGERLAPHNHKYSQPRRLRAQRHVDGGGG